MYNLLRRTTSRRVGRRSSRHSDGAESSAAPSVVRRCKLTHQLDPALKARLCFRICFSPLIESTVLSNPSGFKLTQLAPLHRGERCVVAPGGGGGGGDGRRRRRVDFREIDEGAA